MASELRVDKIVPTDGVPTGGGGGIIQVKQSLYNSYVTKNNSSFEAVSGFTVVMTPKFNTSKIFVLVTTCGNTNGSKGYGRIMRGSTAIAVGDASGSTVQATFDMNNAGASNRGASYVGQILDSPATTSATTYKLQVRHENGSGNININRINSTDDSAVAGRYSSTITLMEFSV